MNTPSLVARRVVTAFVVATAIAFTASLGAQIPARNVNMVSGLEWPLGDPFLQRQNEPSMAASTRNPLHLLAGSNDYRSVDLAGILGNDNEVGDAWAGLYTSTDGGERWTSTLVPGFPHDPDPRGQASPIYGYHAAADPVVRAGTHGLMYFAGLAFDRSATGFGKSAIYVARFIDNNNQEAVSPFEYINTSLVATQSASSNVFLDKPWMAVDIPRQGAGTCNITTSNEHGPFTQQLPAGNVYVAFTVKSVDSLGDRWDMYFSRSVDCGVHFSTPARISRAQDRVNQGASIVISPTTGDVFVSWRRIDLDNTDLVEEHAIVVARSVDKGNKFSNPGVARRFPRGKKKGLNPAGNPGKGKQNTIQASTEFELAPFDQPTSDVDKQFRTNAYPTMTADGTGRLYLAWTERGFASERNDPAEGDARILITTSMDGVTWTLPSVVSDGPTQKGHQLMPALSFAGGKLMMIYYDLQEDRSQVFTKYVDDKTSIAQSPPRRHTFDVRVVTASPGATPAFLPSQSVSSYMMGTRSSTGNLEQLQVNPPNLPMFKLGTVPFIGDYIDLAPSPSFVPTASGGWTYNTAPTTTPPVFHAVWTDNRDVKPPYTKDWRDYTPPTYSGQRPDPDAPIVVCLSGLAGSRNQNIYTARITGGLVVGSPQNSKQLSTTLQRAFVVFAQNTTDSLTPKTFRMTILNQPANGRASFNQYPLPPFTPASAPPLVTIDLTIPRFTTASRTVYVTSSDPHAQVFVDVSEIPSVGAPGETPGGLEGTVILNPDVLNPEVDNPEVDNPEVDNPEVDNAEVYNPEVDNPEVDNPEVDNPEVDNPEVDNPEVDNIVVGNPEVDNPEVDNPEVDNPEVDNPEVDNPEVDNGALISGGGVITDVTWRIKNIGNTTTAYNVNLFLRHSTTPSDGRAQLLIYRVYKTPIIKATSCDVKTVTQNVLVANIPDPLLVLPGGQPSDPNDSVRTNGTVWIEPEKEVRVTLRIFDPIKADNININGASIDPEWVPESDVSLFAQAQPVNTPDAATITEPPLVGVPPDPLMLTVTSDADLGPGSLREAMTLAEAMPGRNTIVFNIPSAGFHTIALATLLPTQEDSVVIDGSTQPGYSGAPVITIDGSAIAGGGSGFRLRGGASMIRGLAIGGFGDHGIWLDNLGSNEVYGNYVGFDVSGTLSLLNGNGNISVDGPNNIVGSMAAGDRNVIGNGAFYGVSITSSGNRVEGNYIGTDVTGNVAAPQLVGVIVSGAGATGNTIGGNLISGHDLAYGVAVNGPANTIEKNTIGLNAAGNVALPNASGIVISDAINNRVINNTLSGNTVRGLRIERNTVDPTGTEVTGNIIGLNPAGGLPFPNNMGIELAGVSNVTIGGAGAAKNVISGNIVDGINLNQMNAAPNLPSTSNVIKGNYIGLNAAGTAAVPNGFAGISITHGSNNSIGGADFTESNVISGNAGPGIVICCGSNLDNNVVIRNLIGLNVTGTAAIGNGGSGISLGGGGVPVTNTRIGGIGETNVISGNSGSGIQLSSGVTGTLIRKNMIGVALDLVTDLGNGQNGITVNAASGTIIGGVGFGNLLSGNAGHGIAVFGGPNTYMDENFIGVADGGAAAVPNDSGGILVTGAGASNFTIGDIAGNLVSGNGGFAGIAIQDTPPGNVKKNKVGVNNAGNAALPNNNNGIDADNVGATIFEQNVVSGNTGNGIYVVASDGAVIKSNTVGLDVALTNAIANGANGIFAEFLSNATIGGPLAGDRNFASGNTAAGIKINSTINTNVRGNLVGTNFNGLVARPNAIGIQVSGPTTTGTIGGIGSPNLISGNTTFGIQVLNANGISIFSNRIGVDATLISALPNQVGIEVQAGTATIGTAIAGAENAIAGNTGDGIRISGGLPGTVIEGNFIGIDGSGTFSVPNGGHGINVIGGQPFIVGNNIANNGLDGVAVVGATGVTIVSSIYANGGLPIDLGDDGDTGNDAGDADVGANNLQNYPSITFVAGNVQGELFSTPNSQFTITAYSGSAVGNARVILGSVVCNTDPAGHCFWGPIAAAPPSGSRVTATATDTAGNTSEMGIWFVVP